ncbi:hypothetical protein TrVE_jg876 [Triparma verrucosa]|uniref:Uncharacterized protein n=1 Tax=Triparma verrucosa TaxID=1606542 RepID=A0A9W7EVR8_9STRA|nr:hypothetical protein TrVE_jg876 [Triparma verrucosa]
MGARNSIAINVDGQCHSAGSTLTGSITPITKEGAAPDMSQLKDNAVSLTLRGRETAVVQYTVRVGDETKRRTAREERDVVTITHPLNTTEAKTVFNFTIKLPDFLPETFSVGNRGTGVRYDLRVFVGGKKLGQLKDIIIKASPSPTVSTAKRFAEPSTSSIKFCCCINRGEITFGGCVSPAAVKCSSDVNVGYAVKNNSIVEMSKCTIELRETYVAHARGHYERITKSVRKYDIEGAIGSSSLMNILPKGAVNREKVNKELYAMLNDDTKNSKAISTSGCVPDYAGQLIHVQHHFKLTVKTPMCTTDPSEKIPFCILGSGDGTNSPTKIPTAQAPHNLPQPLEPSYIGRQPEAGFHDEDEEDEELSLRTMATAASPSFARIISELDDSYDDLTVLRSWERDHPRFIQGFSPADAQQVVSKVDYSFDRPAAAEIVARTMGSKFTCDHVVAITAQAQNGFDKTDLVNKLAPMASDLATNKGKIVALLSDYEQQVCSAALG